MAIQLTPEQIERLSESRAMIEIIKAEIAKAETAGIDVSDLKSRLDQVETMATGIMNVYGPQGRTRRR